MAVPTSSYLVQNNPRGAATGPAELLTSFDAVFPIGNNGFPAHQAYIAFPISGLNRGRHCGTYTFKLRFMDDRGQIRPGTDLWAAYYNCRQGPYGPFVLFAWRTLPRLTGPNRLKMWGSVRFTQGRFPAGFPASSNDGDVIYSVDNDTIWLAPDGEMDDDVGGEINMPGTTGGPDPNPDFPYEDIPFDLPEDDFLPPIPDLDDGIESIDTSDECNVAKVGYGQYKAGFEEALPLGIGMLPLESDPQ